VSRRSGAITTEKRAITAERQHQQEEQCAVCSKTLPANQMEAIPPTEPGQRPTNVCSESCKEKYQSNPQRYKAMAQREKGEVPPPSPSATGP
jgi:predicted nucleic acid-binding Zn ribbon protein